MSKASRRIRKIAIGIQLALDGEYASACPPCVHTDHMFCISPDIDDNVCCCVAIMANAPVEESHERGGQVKDFGDITDVQSTGRKRCAIMYPIEDGMVCEWAKLQNSGGGVVPVMGCLGNAATNRHHGPDKNTLNNTAGNVHRICSHCHNWWHGQNDRYYGSRPSGTEPFIPVGESSWTLHDKETTATIEEVVLDQLKRKAK